MATAIIPPHNQFHLCLGTFFAVWDYITSSVVFFACSRKFRFSLSDKSMVSQKVTYISQELRVQNWLPVKYRVNLKIKMSVYQASHGYAHFSLDTKPYSDLSSQKVLSLKMN